jgi:opacity protein-like surface antigen
MKKFFAVSMAAVVIALSSGISFSYAGEVDILLQKLVDKGVLSAGEAQEIKTETQEQVKKDIASGTSSSLPQWVQNTKLKGDFRVRYQLDHAKPSDSKVTSDRNRGRIRVRLGVDSKVNDKLGVSVGIATGTTDVTSYDASRSNNQSFANSFAKKGLVLNYAYATYSPTPWATLLAGKMAFGPWAPTDVAWDNDITPEGAVVILSKNINSKTKLFMNTMGFVLSETEPSTHNAMAYGVQPGIEYQLTDNISLKGTFSYFTWQAVKGRLLDGSQATNSRNGQGLMRAFNTISPAGQVAFKDPFKNIGLNLPVLADIPEFAVFGEYYKNTSASAKNTGFATGFQLGQPKIESWAQWQFKYVYSMLEKDAVLDILPDSDRYSGKTGIRAHKGELSFGLSKNTYLKFAGFRVWNINQIGTNRKAPTTVFQADWNMKF